MTALDGFGHIRYLGISFSRSRRDFSLSVTAAVSPDHHNPLGVVHGGVIASIADIACGGLVTVALGRITATRGLEVAFLHGIEAPAHIMATAELTMHDERTAVTTFEVHHENELVANGSATFTLGASVDPASFDEAAGGLVTYTP